MPSIRNIREIAIDNLGSNGITITASEEGRPFQVHLEISGEVLSILEGFEAELVRIAKDRFARIENENRAMTPDGQLNLV